MKNIKQKLLQCLREAGAVFVNDSPLLGNFPTEFENGYLEFHWDDGDGLGYEVIINEDDLDNSESTFEKGKFTLNLPDGVVEITPYKLVPFN